MQNGMFDINIEYRNVGGFKNIALRKFTKEIKKKYDEDCKFIITLCRDTDVFELAPKPPVKWDEVESDMYAAGAAAKKLVSKSTSRSTKSKAGKVLANHKARYH